MPWTQQPSSLSCKGGPKELAQKSVRLLMHGRLAHGWLLREGCRHWVRPEWIPRSLTWIMSRSEKRPRWHRSSPRKPSSEGRRSRLGSICGTWKTWEAWKPRIALCKWPTSGHAFLLWRRVTLDSHVDGHVGLDLFVTRGSSGPVIVIVRVRARPSLDRRCLTCHHRLCWNCCSLGCHFCTFTFLEVIFVAGCGSPLCALALGYKVLCVRSTCMLWTGDREAC